LETLQGRSIADLKTARDPEVEPWVLDWEFRATYRDSLTSTERLLSGTWHPSYAEGEPIPISIDNEFVRDTGLRLGDRIRFNVHGLSLDTVVASIRKVDWQKMTTNFFVVFPPGVLEEAPHYFAMVTQANSPAVSAGLQRAVVRQYPHVSVIDLSTVLDAVETLLGKVRFVFRFMSLFTILTGLVVMTGSILTGNSERKRESILLRTIGASRAQLRRIYLVEYLGLGAMSAVLGLGLAYLGAWAVCRFVMEVPLSPAPGAAAGMLAGSMALTALLGLGLSRGILDRPPLESLRDERFE
jgi:putative ABC transport system permease protein